MNLSRLLTMASTSILLSGLLSCTQHTPAEFEGADIADTTTHHAKYLTIAHLPNGTTAVDIKSPFDSSANLARYLLVHRDSILPKEIPAEVSVIRTPVNNAAVFSSIHTAAMNELNVLDNLCAVADASFFPQSDTVFSLISKGKVTDVGLSTLPSTERLAASGAEIVIRSPIKGATSIQWPSGIVAVECVDYLEPTPIGRAEWILLLGELFGRSERANEIFTDVIDDYSNLVNKVKSAQSPRPVVLPDTEYMGVWYVPAGESYQARLLYDAGADYPWSNTSGTGALSLSLESVAARTIDSDIWLIKTYGYDSSKESLKSLNPRYVAFRPWREGNIYSCNTAERLIFNDMAFHPEKILAEYVAIFHPELLPDYKLKYFVKSI